jgi:hypothetical protein
VDGHQQVHHIQFLPFCKIFAKMAVPKKRPNAAVKSPPILSQEFFIQNHADVFSVVTIVILLGMMAPVS